MSSTGGGGGGGKGDDDSISKRFRASLDMDGNKPDSVRLPDPGSPRSPLRTRPAASSSSSSSGSLGVLQNPSRRSDSHSGQRTHSGELSGSSDSSPTVKPRPGHRRSGSGPLLYTGGAFHSTTTTATSPAGNVLPAGNICPSGRVGKGGMLPRAAARKDVLGSGTGHYGHGSIMRGGIGSSGGGKQSAAPSAAPPAPPAGDLQSVTKGGNECYKKGNLGAALSYYDVAVEMSPGNAACRNNRAAALTGLGRLAEAVKECEEAVRLDPAYWRAHHRLAMLHLRLGQVESSKKHLYCDGYQPDPDDLRKLEEVEKHLGRCADSRKAGDWKGALREADAAIAAGADSCSLLIAARAEALLQLRQLNEAESALSSLPKIMSTSPSCSSSNIFGMASDSYVYIVQAQVEMALGRFESSVTAAEKAQRMDSRSMEVTAKLNTVKSVARARTQGNELYKSGNYAEASTAYGEGIKFDPLNPVLYCNRAACRSKLRQWDRSVEDCNEALKIHPSYVKALLRRADSYTKLERWVEAVRDYEALRKALPNDKEVAESLFHAQVALKSSRGEDVSNMKFGGEVEEITGVEQLQAAISLKGVSVVFFMDPSSDQCTNISPFVDTLCNRHPAINFLKVNRSRSPAVAEAENVRIVPTFKIYKNGSRLKEMISPSKTLLDHSVRHYDLR